MKLYFGYIRVSTVRQGVQGVSMQEQKEAILQYARKNDLQIADWFEERETAAKQGRPVFNQMLGLIARRKASGVIIHKIDRSARNLRDWTELIEPIGFGIDVRFADGDIDLNTRGGRLVADMKAVVAADYVRNLREEVKKGFYGRLKQGLTPLPAPLGYLNNGAGKPKTPDPVKAPLVREAFELYSSGRFTIASLADALYQKGLRSKKGRRVPVNSLADLLHNPFYMGLILLRGSGQIFEGVHEPIIPKALFDRVQDVCRGKVNQRHLKHEFLFRRMLRCRHCAYSLYGETRKGHIYYRCQSGKGCPTTCIREEPIEQELVCQLRRLEFLEGELPYLESRLPKLAQDWKQAEKTALDAMNLRAQQIHTRLDRLTDALLDGAVDKTTFEDRKRSLLLERKDVEEKISRAKENSRFLPDRLADILELARSASLLYDSANQQRKRELMLIVTSDRQVDAKTPLFTLSEPFAQVANRYKNQYGGSVDGWARTWDPLIRSLISWLKDHPAVPWLDNTDSRKFAMVSESTSQPQTSRYASRAPTPASL